jgi:hypothetical protein
MPTTGPLKRFLDLPTGVLGLFVFLVAVAVFSPSARVGFVLDDEAQVTLNPAVRDLDLGTIFGQGYWANVTASRQGFGRGGDLYRPLTTLSVALSYQVFGTSPRGYHLENILYHALAAWLALLLLLRWGLPRPAALFAALLFAVAPIHIEPVASVILRNELLAGIFSFLMLLCLTSPGRIQLWLCAPLALLAALLAKESSIALPFLALLADWILVRPRWRDRLVPYALMAAVCLLYLGMRGAVLGHVVLANPEIVYFGRKSTLIVWLTMARFGFEHYLAGALLGHPLVFDYSPRSFPDAGPGDLRAWFSLLFWVALAGGCVVLAVRRRSLWAFGPLFFLLALGPTSNLLTRIGVLGATRLLYLPYLGLAVLLSVAGAAFARRWGGRAAWILALAGTVFLVWNVIQTERRLRPWRDSYHLYGDIVAHAPENNLARINLGNEAVSFSLGMRQPPGNDPARTRPEWANLAFDHYAIGLGAYPRNYRFVMPNLIYAALTAHREEDLVGVIDAAVRAGYPASRVEPLPDGEWGERAPLTDADYRSLTAWAASLQFLSGGGPEDRALYPLCRALPEILRYKSYHRAVQALARDGDRSGAQRVAAESAPALAEARAAVRTLGSSGDRMLATAARSLQESLLQWQREMQSPLMR